MALNLQKSPPTLATQVASFFDGNVVFKVWETGNTSEYVYVEQFGAAELQPNGALVGFKLITGGDLGVDPEDANNGHLNWEALINGSVVDWFPALSKYFTAGQICRVGNTLYRVLSGTTVTERLNNPSLANVAYEELNPGTLTDLEKQALDTVPLGITTVTGAFTTDNSHFNREIQITGVPTLHVPDDAACVGKKITLRNTHSSKLAVAAGTGVTIEETDKSVEPLKWISVVCISTNTTDTAVYSVIGGVAA